MSIKLKWYWSVANYKNISVGRENIYITPNVVLNLNSNVGILTKNWDYRVIVCLQIPQSTVVNMDNQLKEVGFSLIDAKIIVFLLYCISVGFCFGALTVQFL